MFILTDEPVTWITVRVPRLDEAGNPTEQTCRVKVLLVEYDRYNEMVSLKETSPEEERALIRELARDWDGIVLPNKQPLPFNTENLNKVMASPMWIGSFFTAYFRGWSGRQEEREGNSTGSVAGGPAEPIPTPPPAQPSPATPTSSA